MFNHNTLEQDMERLSREIGERRARPEYKDLSERGVVKKVIEPMIERAVKQAALQSSQRADEDDTGLPDYLRDSPGEVKLAVEKLVDEVFHNGLNRAVEKAKKSDPFLLDALRDALADKLYEELKKRKLL